MATTTDVRRLLEGTSLPKPLVQDLLDGASATWLMGEPAEVLAADLALCHPPLADDEVRAIAQPTHGPAASWRIALLAADRPGLLARSAGALSLAGLDITSASGTTFAGRDLALLRLHATPVTGRTLRDEEWDQLGERLRSTVGRREPVSPTFDPVATATVEAMPDGGGRCVVTLHAADRPGLLWRTADWFEGTGCNIEAVRVTSQDGEACGTFVVAGEVDPAALVEALTTQPIALALPTRAKWAIRGATASVVAAATVLRRARRQGSS